MKRSLSPVCMGSAQQRRSHDWFDSPRAKFARPPAERVSSDNGLAVPSSDPLGEEGAAAPLHAALFQDQRPDLGRPQALTHQQQWHWAQIPPKVLSRDRSTSDTSSASVDSIVTGAMANDEISQPAGTHSNPILSSVICRPNVADWTPPQHPVAATEYLEQSRSMPLTSHTVGSPQRPSSLQHDSQTASEQLIHEASMPRGFIPTAQAPSPPRRSPDFLANTASPAKHASPPTGPTTPHCKAVDTLHDTPPSSPCRTAFTAAQAPANKRNREGRFIDRVEAASPTKTRSSRFRGVTKHRRSGRFEAHIWVKELGRQVYLGGYEHEEHAAEAYDVAALKCKGFRVKTNFDAERYSDLTECMDSISLEELIMAVRRQSQGFSRGTSSYRGVTHHPSGRWEARIGIPGSKHIYLGLFNAEKEAAQAYDRALVRLRGTAAATNFALSDYRSDLADYHKMQQIVLQSNKSMEELLGSGQNFERWIKLGCVDRSVDMDPDELPVTFGTAAGLHDELRAVHTRQRTREEAEAAHSGNAELNDDHTGDKAKLAAI